MTTQASQLTSQRKHGRNNKSAAQTDASRSAQLHSAPNAPTLQALRAGSFLTDVTTARTSALTKYNSHRYHIMNPRSERLGKRTRNHHKLTITKLQSNKSKHNRQQKNKNNIEQT